MLPSSSLLPLKVTGNTGRLAVRQSASAVANGLIERLGTPVIATSANRSGSPTCRSGIEALGSMDGRIDLILDGGEVDGLGATTVDITEPEWKLIKEGGVSQGQLEDCLDAPA
ncbi:MAG: Sua5/YciO/YrdC/YwlC family protein [Bryobacterales bacterium]